jgi:hypothetical protein
MPPTAPALIHDGSNHTAATPQDSAIGSGARQLGFLRYPADCFPPLLRSSPRNRRHAADKNEDSERCSHQERACPEAPVTVHPSPVRTRIRFTAIAAVSFRVVPVSRHCVSFFYLRTVVPATTISWRPPMQPLLPAWLSEAARADIPRV